MNQFKKLNNIVGWIVFLIASFVYLSTIEQTVSFWDCGEYISTAYKLEVGHPPGAPLFQLFGRVFSLFAEGGFDATSPATSEVAMSINIMSAICSSLTILFLFWTITAFGRKLMFTSNEFSFPKIFSVIAAGVIGSLAYTFSDSFWFSAVEGEVYAMSSLFTAVTFWCIMKWESEADTPHASRWLVLIAYLIGLSIGVHLLSLLTIPAMGMIYYFKKYKYTKEGAFGALIISVLILGLVQSIIIPGAVSLISKFELFFVNTIGLPFNSGTIIYFIFIVVAISSLIYYTQKHKKAIWNTAVVGIMMLLIGYSSFAILVVRSNANPPIDENNPEDAVGLLSYLKREQYGSWPIVYGQHFNAKPSKYIDGNPVYAKGISIKVPGAKKAKEFTSEDKAKQFIKNKKIKKSFEEIRKDKYVIIDNRKKSIPSYSSKDKMLFPRMWSRTQSRHPAGYISWAGIEKKDANKKPTFAQNIKFFINYQIGWSYFRYFMWNFAGRQNDFMNMDGNSIHGNWESGISLIDNARLGTPREVESGTPWLFSTEIEKPNYLKNNKATNHYFFLPLILGLIGMFFHFKKNNQDALSVLLFFLFTGVLIIIYLNVVPFQPRERDYAYVGSFYAFSIWIGLGVLSIFEYLSKITSKRNSAYLASLLAISVPTIMAAENWDDHDRTGRFTALEVAKNYLNSCEKNAILFTNGDNDTFPLWYAQEVEGIRTDIKVVNLSLFNTDWYIDQMKRASYEAQPIPSSFKKEDYRAGTRDYTPIQVKSNSFEDVRNVIKFMLNEKTKIRTTTGKRISYCPTKKLKLPVDIEQAKSFVPIEYHDNILSEIKWTLKGDGIFKNKLLVLDILANFNWERPIYFAITVGSDNFMGLEDYFQLDGLAYRLVPYKVKSLDRQTGVVNTEKMYKKLVQEFKWGGLNNPEIYFDETNTRMVMNFRNIYSRLAESLYIKGESKKAIEVLDKCMSEFPAEIVKMSYFSLPIVDTYFKLEEKEKGEKILVSMMKDYITEYKFLKEFKRNSGVKDNTTLSIQILGSLASIVKQHELEDLNFQYFEKNNKYFKKSIKDQSSTEIEIDNIEYKINTFIDEYYALQK